MVNKGEYKTWPLLFLQKRQLYIRTTTTTIVLQPFVRDYPGEPVPEETLTHPPTILIIIQSLSASSIYHDP